MPNVGEGLGRLERMCKGLRRRGGWGDGGRLVLRGWAVGLHKVCGMLCYGHWLLWRGWERGWCRARPGGPCLVWSKSLG